MEPFPNTVGKYPYDIHKGYKEPWGFAKNPDWNISEECEPILA
jgi:hypothetical protein